MTNAIYELKSCPFCGGEASWIAARQMEDGTYYPAACGCRKCGIWRYGESDYGHGGFATEEDRERSMKQAVSKWNTRTPEQAISATLGSGKLTAEQVQAVIFAHSSCAGRENGEYFANDIRMQAIADELNAALGGRECELVEVDSYRSDMEIIHVLECSACGKTCEHVNGSYPKCPHCGARAVKR